MTGTAHQSPDSLRVSVASPRIAPRMAGISSRLTARPATGAIRTTTASVSCQCWGPFTSSPISSPVSSSGISSASTRMRPGRTSPHSPAPRAAATAPSPIHDHGRVR